MIRVYNSYSNDTIKHIPDVTNPASKFSSIKKPTISDLGFINYRNDVLSDMLRVWRTTVLNKEKRKKTQRFLIGILLFTATIYPSAFPFSREKNSADFFTIKKPRPFLIGVL